MITRYTKIFALILCSIGLTVPIISMQNGPVVIGFDYHDPQDALQFIDQLLTGNQGYNEQDLARLLDQLANNNPNPSNSNTPPPKDPPGWDDLSDDDEGIHCPICLENYTEDTVIMQLDCDQKVNHHMCLECLDHFKVEDVCPICRAAIKLHDLRISKNNNAKIHHLRRSLTADEQNKLQKVLNFFPTSNKSTTPHSILHPPTQNNSSVSSGYGKYIFGVICAGVALWLINEYYQSGNDPSNNSDHNIPPDQSKRHYKAGKYGTVKLIRTS